jgi:hypothetical protein
MSKIIAILCADIHLSHRAPIARSAEPDWYKAMKRPLKQLCDLAADYSVPVICAGDVFDRWNSPPELINFALTHLPEMYAVPGQHDLPNHSYEERKRSAYWTLVEAGRITELGKGDVVGSGLLCNGFPWGEDVRPPIKEDGMWVAVIHKYIYRTDEGYPGAPKEQRVAGYSKALEGYDVAVFGDNHIGFHWDGDNRTFCQVFNCGSLMRRNIDQRDYEPMVGLLHSDGTVKPHFLDCSEDKFIDEERTGAEPITGLDLTRFMEELEELGGGELDFRSAMDFYFKRTEVDKSVQKIVLEAMEEE